jgi:hypothetical protein
LKVKSYLPVLIYLRTYLFTEAFKLRHRIGASSFSRERKFNIGTLIVSQIKGLTKSLSVAVVEILKWQSPGDLSKDYTKQAYSKYRKNLKHGAHIEINTVLLNKIYAEYPVKCYKKDYVLGMIDGTNLELPNEPALTAHFGQASGGASSFKDHLTMAKGSVCYDVLNNLSWDMQIEPYASCERRLANAHLIGLTTGLAPDLPPLIDSLRQHNRRLLLLFDRGYPSLRLFVELGHHGVGFVCRSPYNFCTEMVEFAASTAVDAIVDLDLTTESRRRGSLADLLKTDMPVPDILRLRFVKIPLSSGEMEYLITDRCDEIEFLYADFASLYALRWGGETQYNYLKNTVEIENFSGKLVNSVLQDAYARQLSFNICQMMLTEAEALMSTAMPQTKDRTTETTTETETTTATATATATTTATATRVSEPEGSGIQDSAGVPIKLAKKKEKIKREITTYKVNRAVGIGLIIAEMGNLLYNPKTNLKKLYNSLILKISKRKNPVCPNRKYPENDSNQTKETQKRKRKYKHKFPINQRRTI